MRGLNKLYWLKIDIENIKEEMNTVISAIDYSGMPHSTEVSDTVHQMYLKREKLTEKLHKKVNQYLDELIRIENIIDRIEDDEIRAMARMRFVQNMKWEAIGKKVGYDRTVCSKKVRRYFENKQI